MRAQQSVLQKAIPLCGIVLILGMLACDRVTFYSYRIKDAAQSSSGGQEVIATIQDFLRNVPANRNETYDRFFANDLIYTRSTGQVVTKREILADAGNASVPRANARFTGEDFKVHQYGDMAVVNFKLVMHATSDSNPAAREFRNTGTFMKRNGRWQAVAWQATPIAEQH